MENCDLLTKTGECKKYGASRQKCKYNVSSIEWFDEQFGTCEIDEVCRRASIFGNSYYVISKEDLDDLRAGKVLFSVDEYGTFIILEADSEDKEE